MVRDYLTRSFTARINAAEARVMSLLSRELSGQKEVALARQRAETDLADLRRTRAERLAKLDRLGVVRTGPVRHVATALVVPAAATCDEPGAASPDLAEPLEDEATKREVELAAMRIVMDYERGRGWEPEDVSTEYVGFDIRSLGPADPATGQRAVRRIEVKGRKSGQPVHLTTNEWLKARQLGDTFWLYVVWDPRAPGAQPLLVKDPGHALDYAKREVREVSHYELPATAIERAAE